MNELREKQVLAAVRSVERKKKRVTFFITEDSKAALARWCHEHDVTESGTVEEMIKATIPAKYFKRGT